MSFITLPRLCGLVAALAAGLTATARARADIACPIQVCGGNSPQLHGVDIRGLHVGGAANVEGQRIAPTSIRLASMIPPWMTGGLFPSGSAGHGCTYAGHPQDLRLGVVDHRLVVYQEAPSGAPGARFDGACLIGATFQIAVGRQPRTEVRIDAVDRVSSWHVERAQRREYEMYRFVSRTPGALAAGQSSICQRKDRTLMEEWQVGGLNCDAGTCANPPGTAHVPWRAATDLAFVAGGEIYGDRPGVGFEIVTGEQGRDWFQIACAGSAVSKLLLLGLDPYRAQERPLRLATLAMLAARYDGKTDATVPGEKLQYELVGGPAFLGWPEPSKVYRVEPEAHWSSAGATCLSHPRRWRPGSGVTEIEELSRWGLPPCAGAPPADTLWTTYAVDHSHP